MNAQEIRISKLDDAVIVPRTRIPGVGLGVASEILRDSMPNTAQLLAEIAEAAALFYPKGGIMFTNDEFATRYALLYQDHAEWSQKTFGSDRERGPLASLKHLAKEVEEAQQAIVNSEAFREEMADCFILLMDAMRRGGITPLELVKEAQTKLEVCKARKWQTPVKGEPVEHVRNEVADG